MERIIFTEEFCQPENLYPFTLTRKSQDMRIGILTIREKWERLLGWPSWDKNEDGYKDVFRPLNMDEIGDQDTCLMIHGNILPTPALVDNLKQLRDGEYLVGQSGAGIAFRFTGRQVKEKHRIQVTQTVEARGDTRVLEFPWQIFQLNDWALRQDYELVTGGRTSQPLSSTNQVVNAADIFLEEGASVEHCILNAATGPIYIGRNATILEGSIIRGPFSMDEGSTLKLGSKVYGATTLGPYCVGGGEIKNSVMFGFSNKAHDGYLGDSVLGEWCNLGAGTTNSNLKNNAGNIRVWTPKGQLDAGQKCGVLMGDYSRTAINTAINTGTVISVSCNVFGAGLSPKYIPAFSWGSEGLNRYTLEKALQDAEGWKKLKGHSLTVHEKSILTYIFEHL